MKKVLVLLGFTFTYTLLASSQTTPVGRDVKDSSYKTDTKTDSALTPARSIKTSAWGPTKWFNNTRIVDSAVKKLSGRLGKRFETRTDTTGVKKVSNIEVSNRMERLSRDSKSQFEGVSIKKEDPPFKLTFGNDFMYMQETPLKGTPGFADIFSVATEVQVGKIPLKFDFAKSYNSDTGFDPLQSNLFKLNFDRQKFSGLFKGDLQRFLEFKKNYLSGMEFPQFARKSIRDKLRGVQGASDYTKYSTLNSFLDDPRNTIELFSMDEIALRKQLRALMQQKQEEIQTKAKEGLNPYEGSLINRTDSLKKKTGNAIRSGKMTTDSIFFAQAEQKKITQGVDSIISVVNSLKKQLRENGLSAQNLEVLQYYLSGKDKLDDIDLSIMAEMEKQQKTSKLQYMLGKVQSFQTGSFAAKIPGSSLNRDMFIQGADLTINTRRGPVQVGWGSQRDVGLPKDNGFENSTYSFPRNISYLSVATHSSTFGSGRLSWVGVFNKTDDNSVSPVNALSRTTMAFTISQSLKMNTLGNLTFDISKSASQYNNTISAYHENLFLDKSALGNYFTDELFETLSLGVNHSLELKKAAFSNNFYFNYSGLGYQNPGAAGVSNMRMRLGTNLKKRFFSNKFSLGVRADLKNTPVSYSSNSQWKNFQVQIDGRYSISRQYNISLKYMENGMNKISDMRTPVYSSRKFQFSGNGRYRIGSYYSFSNLNIAKQLFDNKFNLSDVAGTAIISGTAANSNFLTLNYTHTVVMNQFTISGSLFGNKELSGDMLMGDMINSEAGCQYPLFKKLNLSSSMTYLDNKGVARQWGVKQNIHWLAGKHFDISAYLDLRRNLIEPIYKSLYTTGRGELSVRYYLTNN
ncbi:hypothetical protein [Pedobacter sp. SYSU D00535]|uniref:hypothetical protein n=1 Tax=Pedobacter sp. SYSU D00535 TaxID=2810308 RepID=UPI001A967BFA|nr:hypothetical protein [Pedobacter sp. SYSU D00535]